MFSYELTHHQGLYIFSGIMYDSMTPSLHADALYTCDRVKSTKPHCIHVLLCYYWRVSGVKVKVMHNRVWSPNGWVSVTAWLCACHEISPE